MALTTDQFVTKYNGKKVDVDGSPYKQPYQCWDLAEKFAREVLGIPARPCLPTGNGFACGCYNNYTKSATLQKYFKRQKVRDPVTHRLRRPKKGYLVIWECSLPGSGGAGQIDICLTQGDTTGFIGFDQNWGTIAAHRVSHKYSGVLGYLLPRKWY